jgi:hypothetical protein
VKGRQPDGLAEFLKSRIGTQDVQTTIRVQVDCQQIRAGIIGAIEPLEGFVLLAKPRIDQCDIERVPRAWANVAALPST